MSHVAPSASVLVIGSGGREHALVWAMHRSPSVQKVYAAPGNPGMAKLAELIDIAATDVTGITAWAVAHEIGLVVIGPDAAVAAGLADSLQAAGVLAFGPTQAAAELEWSKAFAKGFMQRHSIPTAAYDAFADENEAIRFARQQPLPLVVKADGLAAGKGVLICNSYDEAEAAIRQIMTDRVFGDAGNQVVVEQFLTGEELSVFALIDGVRYALLPLARDYKRLQDGDVGPNTGGMGSYAPVCDVPEGVLEEVRQRVLEPTIAGLTAEGRPYRGVLFVGLMLTPDGPKVLEYNCRFGDPETQVILPLIAGDVAALLRDCATGRIAEGIVPVRDEAAVCVILAAEGYPERPRTGDAISGIAAALDMGATVLQAGTATRDDELVTQGGRVLGVVGMGASLSEATDLAYRAADRITFAGKQFRHDIATGRA